jgi:hypothetical protein
MKKKITEPVKKAVAKSTSSMKVQKVVKAVVSKPTVAKAKVKKKKASSKSYPKAPGRCLICGGYVPNMSVHMDSDHDIDGPGDTDDGPSGGDLGAAGP